MKNYLLIILVILITSCGVDDKKKSLESTLKEEVRELGNPIINRPSREDDISLVKAYIKDSKKVLTDDEGFPLNHEISSVWGRKKPLGISAKVSNKGVYRNTLYLKLSVQELTTILKLNGVEKRKIKFLAQIYDYYILNPAGSDKIPKEFTRKRKIFIPELDSPKVQKEIIKFVTTPDFSQAMFEQNENDKKVSNEWIRISSNFIKHSGIKDYKSVKDSVKIF